MADISYWIGNDGNAYVKGGSFGSGTNVGKPAAAMAGGLEAPQYKGGMSIQAQRIPNPGNPGGSSGSSYSAPTKSLDMAQLQSLDSLISSLSSIKDQAVQKAAIKRDTSLAEKAAEKKREETKYSGKKLTTLQDFAGAKTDTDLNTRDTLENLVSSLSTLGLGGSRALSRQILDAANKSNRKANATQATNNQALDSAWNDYIAGNTGDVQKIQDQYGYDAGEADRAFLQNKQNALYKKADVYNAVDDTGHRAAVMNEANSLNGLIAGAAFMNPQYTGEDKTMATPDLSTYTQDIAKYDTAGIGANGSPLTPAASGIPGAPTAPGNLAVKAIAVNDKDLGIKKKTEGDLGYGA